MLEGYLERYLEENNFHITILKYKATPAPPLHSEYMYMNILLGKSRINILSKRYINPNNFRVLHIRKKYLSFKQFFVVEN